MSMERLAADLPCPECGKRQSDVLDSRGTPTRGIRRRRECHFCLHRWTTFERDERDDVASFTAKEIRIILRKAASLFTTKAHTKPQ